MSESPHAPARTPRILLEPGTHAVFGYGSLLARPSIERTLGRTYEGPFVVCELAGWRRSWDVAMPNRTYFTSVDGAPVFPGEIVYLNIRPVPDDAIVGVVFVVSDEDLAAYDRREWVYDRVAVTRALRGVTVDGGEAWAYVGRPEFIRRDVASWRDAAIRDTYLGIVDSGLAALGPEVRARYERSTDPVPRHLVFADELQQG
jgi:cation transport regulator ChaC